MTFFDSPSSSLQTGQLPAVWIRSATEWGPRRQTADRRPQLPGRAERLALVQLCRRPRAHVVTDSEDGIRGGANNGFTYGVIRSRSACCSSSPADPPAAPPPPPPPPSSSWALAGAIGRGAAPNTVVVKLSLSVTRKLPTPPSDTSLAIFAACRFGCEPHSKTGQGSAVRIPSGDRAGDGRPAAVALKGRLAQVCRRPLEHSQFCRVSRNVSLIGIVTSPA